MKKIICFILTICLTLSIPITTLATGETEEPNPYKNSIFPNAKKILTFTGDIDDYTPVASWCFEDFKELYELGFDELEDRYICYEFMDKGTTLFTFYKILKLYNNEEIPTGLEYSRKDLNDEIQNYLIENGIITSAELFNMQLAFREQTRETPIAFSFGYANSIVDDSYLMYRRELQIMITRLIKVIDPGKEINNLTRIVDIDSSMPDRIDFDATLKLFNLGLFTGNSAGMFNPCEYITKEEFITVIARLCFPDRRRFIDKEAYEKNFISKKVATYKSLDNDTVQKLLSFTGINKSLVTPYDPEHLITGAEAIYLVANSIDRVFVVEPLDPNLSGDELEDAWIDFSYDLCGINNVMLMYCDHSTVFEPISKKALAELFELFSREDFYINASPTIPLKTEFIHSISDGEWPLLCRAVSDGIIENSEEDLSDPNVTQAEFEKMLAKFMIAHATFTPMNYYTFAWQRPNLVTDPNLMPYTSELYPYVLDNAPKEIYEIGMEKFYGENSQNATFMTPKRIFEIKTLREQMPLSYDYLTSFFDLILNIDYRNLDETRFFDQMRPYTYYYIYDKGYKENLEEYLKYVKENEIILSGSAEILFPITYEYEFCWFVRTKVKLKVIHSNTDTALLYLTSNVRFLNDEMEFYIDLMAGPTGSGIYRVSNDYNLLSSVIKGGENFERITE